MATPEKDNCSSTSSSSHYALQVALQTMKERCQNLQKRLTALEEENLSLRMSQSSIHPVGGLSSSDTAIERRVSNQTELEVLREKVSELSRQKLQLTEHISMVAAENRQLWSRLSKLTKDSAQSTTTTSGRMRTEEAGGAGASQNLIRSKTFTKNAPNPKLRERLPREGGADGSFSSEEINLDQLEDVSLLTKCGFIEGGMADMGFLHQASQQQLHQLDGDELELGGGMFDLESNPDAKRCTEGLLEIQKELLRQQVVLKAALGQLPIRKEPCQSCKNRKSDPKPQMVDKTVEVGNDLPIQQPQQQQQHQQFGLMDDIPLPEVPKGGSSSKPTATTVEMEASPGKYFNILQEKIKADAQDKMCPMCGKIYAKNVAFDQFQEHVEGHFIDTELSISLDPTYELISQTVGNF